MARGSSTAAGSLRKRERCGKQIYTFVAELGPPVSSVSVPAELDRRALALTPRSAVALVLLLAWTLALHVPALGKRGGDDPFFIEVAHLWLHGAPPYLNAFDIKPPGYFFLLALAREPCSARAQTALNALTVFCEAATAACLWRLGRQLGAPAAGVFAAFGYPLLSQTLADNPGYPPLALATTAAFARGDEPDLAGATRVVGAGLAIGFALDDQAIGLPGGGAAALAADARAASARATARKRPRLRRRGRRRAARLRACARRAGRLHAVFQRRGPDGAASARPGARDAAAGSCPFRLGAEEDFPARLPRRRGRRARFPRFSRASPQGAPKRSCSGSR